MALMGLLMDQAQRLPYYQELSRKYGFRLLVFASNTIDWTTRRASGLLLSWGRWYEGVYPLPRAVYNRCYPGQREVISALEEALGKGKVFNTTTHFDKLQVHELLHSNEPLRPFLPEARACIGQEVTSLLAQGGKWVIKPRKGQSGRGVYLLEPAGDFVLVTSGMSIPLPIPSGELFSAFLDLAIAETPYVLQSHVEGALYEGGRFDVRLVVQKNRHGEWEVAGELSRVTAPGVFITNYYRALYHPRKVLPVFKGRAMPIHQLMRKLAILAARQLDGSLGTLGEICVDFIVDPQGKPWIIEVNGKPDKGLFHELGDKEMLERIYLTPLMYLHSLGKRS